MALHLNDPGFRRDRIGMPDSHAEQFSLIAQNERCVIMSRAPGPKCLQLLEQGYDTKGFRVHGKSCDWGPMAGFVLRDPKLNKKGLDNEGFNRREHAEAMGDTNHAGWSAGVTPLKLYQQRVDWLLANGLQVNAMGADIILGTANHNTGIHFAYALIKEQVGGQGVWGVYFDNSKSPYRQEVGPASRSYRRESAWNIFDTRFEAMLAMTNPSGHASWPAGDFRNAITGDYDLFAVWPMADAYDPEGADRRLFGTAQARTDNTGANPLIDQMEHDFTRVGAHAQATKIGNITNRIYLICQLLNSAIGQAHSATSIPQGPHPKRNVCWHSDESARPGVDDVDLPLIAFAPSGAEFGIENINDFRDFVNACIDHEINVTLAEGWILNPDPANRKGNRLGTGPGGLYESLVPKWRRGPGGVPQKMDVPSWYNR